MLGKQNIISEQDSKIIKNELEKIQRDIESGNLEIDENAEDINKKVISIFKSQNSELESEYEEKIKYFAGFNYVKLKRDVAGKKFVALNLEKYAEKCRYIVSVMRTIDNEVCLYNYDIKSSELPEFMKALENKTLVGKLIEIEKYIPEDLA